MPWSKSGKTRQKVDLVAIGQAKKGVINSRTKIMMAAGNFWISETAKSSFVEVSRARKCCSLIN